MSRTRNIIITVITTIGLTAGIGAAAGVPAHASVSCTTCTWMRG